MRGWLLSLALSVALVGPATAQGATKPSTQPAKPADPMAHRSVLAGVALPIPAFALPPDALYADFIAKAAGDIGRRCQGLEVFGWEFKKGDQARLSEIVDQTMAVIERGGYKLAQVQAPSLESPMSVAITGDKAKKRLLMVWAPVSDATMLLICDASAAKK